MSRLGGPEIKLPEVKAPAFLVDLYHDLRERHLLPLVAVLAVAIVAVPIALGSSGSDRPIVTDAGLATLSTSPDGSNTIVVANATPGLRDYRRRLSDLQVKDPFKQQFSAPQIGTTPSSAASASSSTTSAPTPSTSPTSPDGGSSGGGTTTKVQTETNYATYEIDVQIVSTGAQNGSARTSKSEVSVRRNLPELTMLPGRDTPAVVFMGVSADTKKAMLLISSNVKSVFGDARCVIGSDTCQLLALEPGLPETFVYGGHNRTFRIELLKISRIVTKHPRLAPLGKPKHAG